jgi:hypothetical protein
MIKTTVTPLTDELLQSVQEMQQAETDAFFYTRLKARMENEQALPDWAFPLKPAWVIGMLTTLLAVNTFMFTSSMPALQKTTAPLSIKAFAESYDLTVTPTY